MNVRNSQNLLVAALITLANGLAYDRQSTDDDGAIANGTTDGKLKTVNAVDFQIDGVKFTKAGTDDLWDLTGEVDTIAAEFRAYWLYLDSSGVATIVAGTTKTTEALAKAALPALDLTKSVIGVYTAGPTTDFDGAAGLAAQGTIDDGVPVGVPGKASQPDVLNVVPA